MSGIHISQLRKVYGDSVALHGIDLEVIDGEVMALLGPSGCGKTTTLQLLAGFLKPDGGEIRVGDRVVSTPHSVIPPERRNMSLIFQSYAVWPHKTVRENVAFGLEVRRVARADILRRVDRALATVHLDMLADRYPAELSGGQQQRVALARAMVVEPDILLLDEPLSNLDANLREEMRFEVRRLHDETGITMVYVTHDQAEAMVTADRIAVMNLGRIEQVATPFEVYERPTTQFVASFIGRTNTLVGRLSGRGVIELDGLGVKIQAEDETGCLPGQEVAVCIRPHHVRLNRPDGPTNEIQGRVARSAYLGESRDYQVEIGPGLSRVRVTAPPSLDLEVGKDVSVFLPVKDCRVVIRS
jgi:iron(III) transport system ATP-binding protein